MFNDFSIKISAIMIAVSCVSCFSHRTPLGNGRTPAKDHLMNVALMRAELKPNMAFDAVIERFGKPQLVRTLDPPLPKLMDGKYYPVDKIVMYGAVKSSRSQSGSEIVRKKVTQHVTIMFYRSQLKFVFVNVAILGPSNKVLLSEESSESVLRSDKSDRELWVGSYCDSLYYKEKVLGLSVSSGYPCYWKASNFHSLLTEDGYYDRKREGYSLAKDW
ncbi:MAG: hypothetical protein CMN76_06895 [Spirochaetaceae bacterium]|nr:hypothetical protein [Spirochaetaceae bacterium]